MDERFHKIIKVFMLYEQKMFIGDVENLTHYEGLFKRFQNFELSHF